MHSDAKYIFMVSMDVAADKEDLFNEIYDNEHGPNILAVPGVLSVTRAKSLSSILRVGGAHKEIPVASPNYTAIYELDSAEVLVSDDWVQAVEAGRWPGEVRPFTSNRRHILSRVI